MKIVSFGDSFVWGSEIPGNKDGSLGWPGIAAGLLGCEYQTLAEPGCGNESIARQIYTYFADGTADLAVINWTWNSRWDYYITQTDEWVALGPVCVMGQLEKAVGDKGIEDIQKFYKEHLNLGITWGKYRALQTIYAAQKFLDHVGIPVIETYMDTALVNQEWHVPIYIQTLQAQVLPRLKTWQGQNFLEWCQSRGFDITTLYHPSLQAHQEAANFWKDTYAQTLTR